MLADENRINLRLLAPLRGRILDRFGVALADNRQNYHLVIVAEQAGDIAATLDALGELDRDRRGRPAPRLARDSGASIPLFPSWCAPISAGTRWRASRSRSRNCPAFRSTRASTRHYPFGDDRGACRRLCRRGFRAGARRRSAARIAGFPHRQERRRKVAGCRAARHRRHQPGRGQRLWPSRARARPRSRASPGRTWSSASTWRCRNSSPAAAAPSKASPASCSTRHRRRARPGVEPELRSDAVLDRPHPRDVAGAVERSAQAAVQQGDRRRLSAGLDLQAGGRGGRADGRGSDARDLVHLPRISHARQRDVSLLAARRPRHPALARRDQEILRRLLLRDGAPAGHRPPGGDGAPVRLRRASSASIFPASARADPEPRVEARDHRHGVAAGRDADRRDRPGLGSGDPAAARDDGRAPRHRPGRHAAAGARRRLDAAGRRHSRCPISRRSVSIPGLWRSCSTA